MGRLSLEESPVLDSVCVFRILGSLQKAWQTLGLGPPGNDGFILRRDGGRNSDVEEGASG